MQFLFSKNFMSNKSISIFLCIPGQNGAKRGDLDALRSADCRPGSPGRKPGQGNGPQLCGLRSSAAGPQRSGGRAWAAAAWTGAGERKRPGTCVAALWPGGWGAAPASGLYPGGQTALAERRPGGPASGPQGGQSHGCAAGCRPGAALCVYGAASGLRRGPGRALYPYLGIYGRSPKAGTEKGGYPFEIIRAIQRGSGPEGGIHGPGDRQGPGDRYGGGDSVPEEQE